MVLAEAPNVADWMQGWGAVLSLPLSLAALIFTGWLLRHEIKARRDDRADLDAAQARLIRIIWPAEELAVSAKTGEFSVQNDSSGPIYNVMVWGYSRRRGYIGGQRDVAGRLEAGAGTPGSVDLSRITGDGQAFAHLQGVVKFTDASGRDWIRRDNEPPSRYNHGRLEPLTKLTAEYLRTFRWVNGTIRMWQHAGFRIRLALLRRIEADSDRRSHQN